MVFENVVEKISSFTFNLAQEGGEIIRWQKRISILKISISLQERRNEEISYKRYYKSFADFAVYNKLPNDARPKDYQSYKTTF